MKKNFIFFAAAFLIFGLIGCGDHTDPKDLPHDSTGSKPAAAATDNTNPGPGKKGGMLAPPP